MAGELCVWVDNLRLRVQYISLGVQFVDSYTD